MSYQFKKTRDKTNPHSITDVTMDIETESLSNLLEEFELFLKACGFCFDGHVDIINDEPK